MRIILIIAVILLASCTTTQKYNHHINRAAHHIYKFHRTDDNVKRYRHKKKANHHFVEALKIKVGQNIDKKAKENNQ